jgi:Rrf2 family protein
LAVIFSASTTHALRSLAWIAAHGDEGPIMARDLAAKLQLPPDYLQKILGTLARRGLLKATRGVGGGYRLARPANRIKLMEVLEPFEGHRARPGCLLRPDRPCRESNACTAHPSWAKAKAAYLGFVEGTTIADIQGGTSR